MCEKVIDPAEFTTLTRRYSGEDRTRGHSCHGRAKRMQKKWHLKCEIELNTR